VSHGSDMSIPLRLRWQKFAKLTAARTAFAKVPCVYIQADAAERPIRVGKASKGLEVRYRGGTGYALDAAMDGSGNSVFVAGVPAELCDEVERELIWQGRGQLAHNNMGKTACPLRRIRLLHDGTPPDFRQFSVG
jgi:hypothetical protein